MDQRGGSWNNPIFKSVLLARSVAYFRLMRGGVNRDRPIFVWTTTDSRLERISKNKWNDATNGCMQRDPQIRDKTPTRRK